jgi:DNA primase
MILEEGLNVRVVFFPEGDDPDSFAQKHSETEVRNFIEKNRTDFIRFKAQLLYSETKDDPIKKALLIQEIVNSIALIPNSITRTVFIQECSRIMKMDEQALFTELNKALRRRYAKTSAELPIEEVIDLDNLSAPQPVDMDWNTAEHHEKEIIRLLLLYGNHTLEIHSKTKDEEDHAHPEVHSVSVAELISEHLLIDGITFENELYQKIFEEYTSDKTLRLEHFVHHENTEIGKLAVDLTTFPYSLSGWQKKHGIAVQKEEDILKVAVEHAIYSLKVRKLIKMIAETQKQLQEATNEEDILTLVTKKKMLDAAKNAFSRELGWVVLP